MESSVAHVVRPARRFRCVDAAVGAFLPALAHFAGTSPDRTGLEWNPSQRWSLRTVRRVRNSRSPPKEYALLHYAVVFLVIALIAAVFGFGGIAAGAVGIAKILFVVFLVLAAASFLFGLTRGK